jgi:hypothetical protein
VVEESVLIFVDITVTTPTVIVRLVANEIVVVVVNLESTRENFYLFHFYSFLLLRRYGFLFGILRTRRLEFEFVDEISHVDKFLSIQITLVNLLPGSVDEEQFSLLIQTHQSEFHFRHERNHILLSRFLGVVPAQVRESTVGNHEVTVHFLEVVSDIVDDPKPKFNAFL